MAGRAKDLERSISDEADAQAEGQHTIHTARLGGLLSEGGSHVAGRARVGL